MPGHRHRDRDGEAGGQVLTDGQDEEHLSRGIYEAYTQLNLRYSQLAPLSMFEERNTGTNLPAQVEIYAAPGQEYKFLLMAKGGGSANKSFLFQQTKTVLNPAALRAFLEEKIRSLDPLPARRTTWPSWWVAPAPSTR